MHAVQPDAAGLAKRLARAGEAGCSATDWAELMGQVDALFAAHQDVVYATCLRFLREPQAALEIAQDALLKAYEKLPGFRGESRFSTWLVSIARYECLNALRKQRDHLTEDGVVESTDSVRSVLASLQHVERVELFRAASANALEPLEQEAVHLRYIEHLSLARIEEILDLERGNGARVLLQRCKRKLRAELRRQLESRGHGSSFVRGSID